MPHAGESDTNTPRPTGISRPAVRIAKPINTVQTRAAMTGTIPADARALQDKWESILGYRVGLQGLALAALCTTLALL